MRALKLKVTVTANNQITIQLPEDFPEGEAEVIILASNEANNAEWLDRWISSLPKSPTLPTEAFDREEIYR